MQKLAKVAITSGLLAGGVAAVYLVTHNRRRRAEGPKPAKLWNPTPPDLVEEASLQSFPASDAPSWIGAALS